MSDDKKFLLRRNTGDQTLDSDEQIRDLFSKGQCKVGDYLFNFSTKSWARLGDCELLADLFVAKPSQPPERRVIYVSAPGGTAVVQGPYSVKEIQQRILAKEFCERSWVYVDGDKEWRQLRAVKTLFDMMGALPSDAPQASSPSPASTKAPADSDSILIEMPRNDGPAIEREEQTMAFSALGLDLTRDTPAPGAVPPTPPMPSVPPALPKTIAPVAKPAMPPPKPSSPAAAASIGLESDFDGITAEIPMDPVWMLKTGNSETASGPFRFLDVIKFLETGKITKNDKISRAGTNRFVKILQQYEFNVKFSIESVMENGMEKQKILIRRRHPRVPYITGVQVVSKYGLLAGNCINISAGGILMELAKAEFNLGEILDIKILPGLIPKPISCHALVIGRIPKIPPAFALKFEDLKQPDKEAIEYFVQTSIKRESL